VALNCSEFVTDQSYIFSKKVVQKQFANLASKAQKYEKIQYFEKSYFVN